MTYSGERRNRWRYLLARLFGAPAAFLFCQACRISSKKVALALVYHSIADQDGDPNFELVPPHGAASFVSHMRFARACFNVVPASELVGAMERRRRGDRFPLAVTFDDDLGCHRRAAAILRKLRMRATFFLTGSTVDGPAGFWWQLLQACYDRGLSARALATAGVGESELHGAAGAIQHMPRSEREYTTRRLLEVLDGGEVEPGLRADDVRALVATGAEVGFHTLHHDYLPDLDDRALDAAMREGRAGLELATGQEIRTIAYPHGGADDRVAAAARRARYAYGFGGEPGQIMPGDDPLLLTRIEPPRAGQGRFALRVSRHLRNGLRARTGYVEGMSKSLERQAPSRLTGTDGAESGGAALETLSPDAGPEHG